MKKIAIDITRAIIGTAGIGRYTYEMAQELIKNSSHSFLVYSTHFNDSKEKDEKYFSFKKRNVILKRLKIPGYLKEKAWAVKLNFLHGFLEKSDVLYAPSFFETLLGAKIDQVTTIHDMTSALFPSHKGDKLSKYFTTRAILACKVSKKITCVSESTKNDLLKISEIPEDKVEIVYPGLKQFDSIDEKLPPDFKKGKYILSVGTIEPRKNLVSLLKAYSDLDEKLKSEYPLVLIGAKGWNDSEIFAVYKKLGLERYVHFLGYLSDSALARFYKDCLFFAYVSLYEGFGLPVIEAMSFQKAVLTSNISSLPEVAGKSGLLVDPKNIKQLTLSLNKMITDENYLKKLASGAREQAEKFSYKKSADKLLEIFEGL